MAAICSLYIINKSGGLIYYKVWLLLFSLLLTNSKFKLFSVGFLRNLFYMLLIVMAEIIVAVVTGKMDNNDSLIFFPTFC